MPTFAFSPTPNPNSMKITSDGAPFLDAGMASYASPAEAAGDPLGERLFALEGVHNVFMLPQFITITKRADFSWDDLLPELERTLDDFFSAAPEG
jgi:hypothetical protein